jgi:hypothetical protein
MRRLTVIGAVAALLFTGLSISHQTAASAAITICNTVDDVYGASGQTVGYSTFGHYTVNCDFRLSETYNESVKYLQSELNACYGPNATLLRAHRNVFTTALSEDGHYGSRTQAAVKAVQTHLNISGAGLTVDGYAGPKTRTAMLHVEAEYPSCAYVRKPAEIAVPEPPQPLPVSTAHCSFNPNTPTLRGFEELYPTNNLLHGKYRVKYFTERANAEFYAFVQSTDNSLLPAGSKLRLDRSVFGSAPPGGDTWQTTDWILSQPTPTSVKYESCQDESWVADGTLDHLTSAGLVENATYIDGAHYWVRACLQIGGAWGCMDSWYGDNNDNWDDTF